MKLYVNAGDHRLVPLTHADHRAALLALLTAFFWFAFVVVNDGDSGVFICHDGRGGLNTHTCRDAEGPNSLMTMTTKKKTHTQASKRGLSAGQP